MKRLGKSFKLIALIGFMMMSNIVLAEGEFNPFLDDSGFVIDNEDIYMDSMNFKPNDIEGHWAESEIYWAISEAFISGYGDGSFRPDNYVTREEAAKILSKGRKFSRHALNLSDAKNRWSTDYISYMTKFEYINGYPDGSFKPDNYISREEVATIARKIMVGDIEYNMEFNDIGNSYARESVNELGGVISGYEDRSFRPKNYITRAELVAIMSRLEYKSDNFIFDLDNSNYEDFKKEILRNYKNGAYMPIKFKSTRFKEVKSQEEAQLIVMDALAKALKGTYDLSVIIELPTEQSIIYDDNYCEFGITTWITPGQQIILEQWVDYISDFTEGMSIDEKIKYFHDGIIKRADYLINDSWFNNAGVPISSPYSLLNDGYGLCNAYASLFKLFADRNNLPIEYAWGEVYSKYDNSYMGLHAWNIDTRNNKIIDLTWNDGLSPEGRNISDEEISYEYFYSDDSEHNELDYFIDWDNGTIFDPK